MIPDFFGSAVKAGAAHVLLWLFGARAVFLYRRRWWSHILLFVVLSVFPIIPVVRQTAHTQKTVAVLLLANLAGLLLYWLRPQRTFLASKDSPAIETPPACP